MIRTTSRRLRLELDSLKHEVQGALQHRDALTGAYGRVEMLPQLREWSLSAKQGVKQCCVVLMNLTGTVRFLSRHLRPCDKVSLRRR